MRFACEETLQCPRDLIKALGSGFVQSSHDLGFGKVGSAVARDLAGVLVNANDYLMHMLSVMGRVAGVDTVPEFKAEKVSVLSMDLFPSDRRH